MKVLISKQVVSATSAPLKMLNDLLHTKAGRKARNRLQTVAGLASSLAAVLALLGLDPTQPQTVLQVRCARTRFIARHCGQSRIVRCDLPGQPVATENLMSLSISHEQCHKLRRIYGRRPSGEPVFQRRMSLAGSQSERPHAR